MATSLIAKIKPFSEDSALVKLQVSKTLVDKPARCAELLKHTKH